MLLGEGWFPEQVGGLNRYLRELHASLTREGVSSTAVVVSGAGDTGVVVGAKPDEPLAARVRKFAAVAAQESADVDLVDVHFALYAFAPVVMGAARRKPLVVHFHGPWADEGRAAGDGRIVTFAKRLIERSVYRRAILAVTLSGAFKRLLVERYGVRPWGVEVVPPGVDLERFSPGDRGQARAVLGVADDAWVACSVRRLVPRMGVDVLLRAWSAVDRGGRLLLIAGEGPERARLERLATELGLASSVRFLGEIADDHLVSLYRASDVCVVPSLSLEGFGLVVLEAMAAGCPVIASQIGGLPSALAELEPRCTVPAADPEALARRLLGSLPNRSACRAVAERYSWNACAGTHRRLYARALQTPRRRKLRVVYLDHTAQLSGAELALVRLLPFLTDVEPHVILGEEGPLVDRLHEGGVSVEVMQLGAAARSLQREVVSGQAVVSAAGFQSAAYAARLNRRLRQLEPDLVHTNSLKAAFYGGTAGRLARIPVISHVHDRLAEDYLPSAAGGLARAALTHLSRAVIVPSKAVGETLGPLCSRSHVISWPAYASAPMVRAESHPFTVGILGRIAPWKGQHVFIEAFATAFPAGDERAFVIGAPLFGPGEREYLDELRHIADAAGLDGRVTFTGFVDDVNAHLAGLDVLVHASVTPEPFGQVVVEGMAAGLPVVASAAGGPTELIENGTNGLLYPPADVQALAGLLRDLAANPSLRERLGAAARETASANSPEAAADKIRRVYEQVLSRGQT